MAARKQTFLQIYLYAICLVSVAVFLIVVGIGLWGVVQMAFPKLTLNDYEYKNISSFENFKNRQPRVRAIAREGIVEEPGQGIEPTPPPSDEKLRLMWAEAKKELFANEQREGLREFVRMWVWLIIVIPVYVFHWRMARRLKDTPEESAAPA